MSGQATAVAVIRLSGPQAHTTLQGLLGDHQSMPPNRKAVVRTLYDAHGSPLDQALVLTFTGPRSFTGQDIVELHCHGSRAVLMGVLDRLGEMDGTRLAEAGEFTQRAYAAGKLGLLQVEALADLLHADTQSQRQQALQQLEGKLSELYTDWRQQLTRGLAHAEAVIDFGDDEQLTEDDDNYDDDDQDDSLVWGSVRDQMQSLLQEMATHLQDARRGELVREGVRVAIVGPPNAGKSSLFNILAQRDAAIVSPTAGTTRDVLELALDLGGIRCALSDTAGVREETSDSIEQVGIERARQTAKRADVVVAMVDGTDEEQGLETVSRLMEENHVQEDDTHVLLVTNKADLMDSGHSQSHDGPTTPQATPYSPFQARFAMSCETNQGIDEFVQALTNVVKSRVEGNTVSTSTPTPTTATGNTAEGALITRARHRQHVEAAHEALTRFVDLSTQGSMVVDLAAEELRLAASELGRITGAVDVEDVLDVLFADFCIGK